MTQTALRRGGVLGRLLHSFFALWAARWPGGSWWNGDWKFRKEIGFDLSPTAAPTSPARPQDVPVLVRLSLANFSYFNDTKADGSDFRVLSSAMTRRR